MIASSLSIPDSSVTQVGEFDLRTLPSAAYDYVTPMVETDPHGGQSVWLEAGPYVGAIGLLDGRVLYIVPRIGQRSFARMLFLAEGLDEAVRPEFETLARLGHDVEGSSWIKLLARAFVDQLVLIERSSRRPGRIALLTRGDVVRG